MKWFNLGGTGRVEVNGDLDHALRRLTPTLHESDAELRRRRWYVPPSLKRRMKAGRARRRKSR